MKRLALISFFTTITSIEPKRENFQKKKEWWGFRHKFVRIGQISPQHVKLYIYTSYNQVMDCIIWTYGTFVISFKIMLVKNESVLSLTQMRTQN